MKTKHIFKITIHLVLAVIAAAGIFAENRDVKIERISVDHGLSHNGVRFTFQDSHGFLWFGTENGLNRYDGYDFKVFKDSDQNLLADEWNTAMVEDSLGNLWIGTNMLGLKRLDHHTGRFEYFPPKPGNPHSPLSLGITTLLVSKMSGKEAAHTWIGTQEGLSLMTVPVNGNITFRHFRHDPANKSGLAGSYITCLYETEKEGEISLWVTTRGGLSQVVIREGDVKEINNFYHDPFNENSLSCDHLAAVTGTVKNGTHYLWIGSQMGLDRMHRDIQGKWQFKRYKQEPPYPTSVKHNYILSLLPDRLSETGKEIIWVGTYGSGLNRFDPETGTFVNYRYRKTNLNSLSDNRIRHIYKDRSGILWCSSWGGGVNKIIYGKNKLKFKIVNHDPNRENGLSDPVIRCFAEEPGSNGDVMWIGTLAGGLDRFDRKNKRWQNFRHDPSNPDSIGRNTIYRLFFDHSGTLWVGTDQSIEKYLGGGRFEHYVYSPVMPHSLTPGQGIHAFYEDRNGMLWIGSNGGGFMKFDRKDESFYQYYRPEITPNGKRLKQVYTIYGEIENNKEILWLGTMNGGLNRFDIETERVTGVYMNSPEIPGSIGNNNVICIHHCKHGQPGTFWIGTYGGGLSRFDKKTGMFKQYTDRDGLPDKVVYGILHDSKGHLWLSTNNGISRFNRRTETFRNFDVSEGLQGKEYNGGAYFKNSEGEMFFGGVSGYNTFFPKKLQENTTIPPILIRVFKNFKEIAHISSTEIGGVPESIRLQPDENFITFEFAALDYSNPRNNQYAYKLDGIDDDWVYCGSNRRVNYANLEPGTYRFRAKGSNSDYSWNEEGVSLSFEVIPTFHQTWWFNGFMLLALLAAALTGYRVWAMARQKSLLAEQVAVRTQEYKEASEKAQQMAEQARLANEAKSRFLANVSHEIRTPMSGVIGLTDLVLDSPLKEEQKRYLTMAKQCADHLLGILNDILDLSKIEAGQLNLDALGFQLPVLLEEVQNFFLQKVETMGLELKVAIAPEIPERLTGDPNRLKQILLNLVGNAVKFTEQGSIDVSVELKERNTDHVVLLFSVKDTGIGIPEHLRPNIFESFTQVDGSTSRKYGGTGLGLAISRQLVDMMGGRIWFESAVKQGSEFYFTVKLPLLMQMEEAPRVLEKKTDTAKESELDKRQLVERLKPFGEKVNLLLVEDNPINQKVARVMLKKTGIPLDIAEDGVEALEMLREKRYGLILMDVQMPRMDGLTATREIRKKPGFNDTPIIAMTAHAMKEDREKCLDAGMNDYITKPFKPEEFYTALLKWLGV